MTTTFHADARMRERRIDPAAVALVLRTLHGSVNRRDPSQARREVGPSLARKYPELAPHVGLVVITDEADEVVTCYWANWSRRGS